MKRGIYLFLVFPCAVISLQAQFSLQDSLVAYYPFSGNVLDASGNANHGTAVGAILTSDRFGSPNEAYYFDGVNDYVGISDNQNLKPPLPVTLAAWISLEKASGNLIFTNDFQNNVNHGVWLNVPSGKLTTGYGDGGPIGPFSRRSLQGTSSLSLNTWHHVAAVIRGPMDMDLFINGRKECANYNGSGGSLAFSNADGRMGVVDPFAQPGLLTHFRGSIDEVRLYSRALTQPEIEQLAEVSPMTAYDTVCVGETIFLPAPAGYQNYTWTNVSGLSCTTCPNPSVLVSGSAPSSPFYQAILTNAAGCADTFTINLEVIECCPKEFSSVILKKTGGMCPDDSIGSVTLAGAGGTSPYLYAMNGGIFASTGTFTQLVPGSYSFSIQDSAGCETDTTIQIASPPPPIQTQTTVTQQTNVGANDGTASVTTSGGNGGPWTYYWSHGATTDSVAGLAPGIYTVEVKDALGCTKLDTVEVLAVRTSMQDFPDSWQWRVAPNPNEGHFLIEWDFPGQQEVQVQILDVIGRELLSTTFRGSAGRQDLSVNLPTGTYLLQLSVNGRAEFKRMVIE